MESAIKRQPALRCLPTRRSSKHPIDASTCCEIQTRWARGEFVGVFRYGGKLCRTKEAGAESEPIRVGSDQESEVDLGKAEQFGSLFGLRKHAV